MFQRLVADQRNSPLNPAGPAGRTRGRKRPREFAPAPARATSGGTGYSGSARDSAAATISMKQAEEQSKAHDSDLVQSLKELRRSFPDERVDFHMVEPLLACLCCGEASSDEKSPRVSIISWLSAFLCGSLMDLSERRKLAGIAISIVCSLAAHLDMRAALLYVPNESADAGQSWQATIKHSNPNWSYLDASLASHKPPSACVYSRLLVLAQQSSVFLQGTAAEASIHVVADADSESLQACRDFSSLVSTSAADVERQFAAMAQGAASIASLIRSCTTAAPRSSSSSAAAAAVAGNSTGPSKEQQEAYVAEMRPFAYAAVPQLAKDHVLAKKLQVAPPSSVRKLMRVQQELARASSEFVNYGATILLRSDEGRCNVLKALVSGPPGTPYAFGLFGFDIALPPSFPDKCPLVQFTSTGGGHVYCNPNLYADGKVCLSLLGTWQGPGWDPAKSTLGQVLMSIQALILSDNPIQNEPAFANVSAARMSVRVYNAHVRLATMQYGMLACMTQAPSGFEDCTDIFWRHHAQDIARTVDDWVASASQLVAAAAAAPAPPAAPYSSSAYHASLASSQSSTWPAQQVFRGGSLANAVTTVGGLLAQTQRVAKQVKQQLHTFGYL